MKGRIRQGLCAAAVLWGGLAYGEQAAPGIPPEERPDGWSSFLPFMADEAYDRGYELPLPFGVGLNVIGMTREIEVKNIKAGFNELQDVTDLVAVDTRTHVNTLVARGDVWLLPFLNVYVMGGYLENVADIRAGFTLPLPGPGNNTTNIVLDSALDQSGTLVGGGFSLAAGHNDFFLMVDANFTHTELDGILDETIQVAIYSARTGWDGSIGETPLRIWLGGMYWDSERVVKGSAGPIKFEVLQGPVDPFNLTLGTNVELSRQVHLVAEYAFNFNDLRMMTLGATYRF